MEVLIIGAGIGGLTLGLMLHRAGIACRVFEAASELKAVGVGINILPHASRELCALGLEDALAKVAVTTREYCFYNRFGQYIYSEPAGRFAGYDVPQFSIHRGDLQMVLLDAFVARAGADKVTHRLALHPRRIRRRRGDRAFRGRRRQSIAAAARRGGDQLRGHSFDLAQAALPRRRPAEIFRRQHVARRHALEAVHVRRQHDPRRLAPSGQAADLSDPQQYRRRGPPTGELGVRHRDAAISGRATGTGAAGWKTSCRRWRTGSSTGSTCRNSSAQPTRSWNIRWSIRIRCRAGASAG